MRQGQKQMKTVWGWNKHPIPWAEDHAAPLMTSQKADFQNVITLEHKGSEWVKQRVDFPLPAELIFQSRHAAKIDEGNSVGLEWRLHHVWHVCSTRESRSPRTRPTPWTSSSSLQYTSWASSSATSLCMPGPLEASQVPQGQNDVTSCSKVQIYWFEALAVECAAHSRVKPQRFSWTCSPLWLSFLSQPAGQWCHTQRSSQSCWMPPSTTCCLWPWRSCLTVGVSPAGLRLITPLLIVRVSWNFAFVLAPRTVGAAHGQAVHESQQRRAASQVSRCSQRSHFIPKSRTQTPPKKCIIFWII